MLKHLSNHRDCTYCTYRFEWIEVGIVLKVAARFCNHSKNFLLLYVASKIHNLRIMYRVLIKYCVFSLIFFEFLNSASVGAALVFYMPYCVYTHWRRGKTEKGQSPVYSKIFGKNTIFNENPVSASTKLCIQ